MAELYHVLNRGTEKRRIFMDTRDRMRFVRNLYEMNDDYPAANGSRHTDLHEVKDRKRKPLVTIHGWCLMDNHFHLLLSEVVEGGMGRFLQKLNVGYVKYFNERHERTGALFQGKTKRVLIETERHFLFILLYIHCNPLDLTNETAGWRTQCVRNHHAAISQLADYRWSSYPDYSGDTPFRKILDGSFLHESRGEHVQEIARFLRAAHAENADADLTLE